MCIQQNNVCFPLSIAHRVVGIRRDMGISIVLVLIVTFSVVTCNGAGTRPQCIFMSDDPVYSARCDVDVTVPKCIIQCDVPAHNLTCKVLHCWVAALTPIEDQSADEHCPATEIRCDPVQCSAPGATCSPLCEPPQAFWHCRKSNGPAPHAIEQCERPACDASDAEVQVVPIALAKIGSAFALTSSVALILVATLLLLATL